MTCLAVIRLCIVAFHAQATLAYHRDEPLYSDEQWDELKAAVVPCFFNMVTICHDDSLSIGGPLKVETNQ